MDFDEDEVTSEMYLHFLWSTNNQKQVITPAMAQPLYSYICDLALANDCHVIGGQVFNDHLQLVVKFSPEVAISSLISGIKQGTSLWIRANFDEIREFEWQKSDFSFTVSFEEVGSLLEKIKQTTSFVEGVTLLLDECDMEYDRHEILE